MSLYQALQGIPMNRIVWEHYPRAIFLKKGTKWVDLSHREGESSRVLSNFGYTSESLGGTLQKVPFQGGFTKTKKPPPPPPKISHSELPPRSSNFTVRRWGPRLLYF